MPPKSPIIKNWTSSKQNGGEGFFTGRKKARLCWVPSKHTILQKKKPFKEKGSLVLKVTLQKAIPRKESTRKFGRGHLKRT